MTDYCVVVRLTQATATNVRTCAKVKGIGFSEAADTLCQEALEIWNARDLPKAVEPVPEPVVDLEDDPDLLPRLLRKVTGYGAKRGLTPTEALVKIVNIGVGRQEALDTYNAKMAIARAKHKI